MRPHSFGMGHLSARTRPLAPRNAVEETTATLLDKIFTVELLSPALCSRARSTGGFILNERLPAAARWDAQRMALQAHGCFGLGVGILVQAFAAKDAKA